MRSLDTIENNFLRRGGLVLVCGALALLVAGIIVLMLPYEMLRGAWRGARDVYRFEMEGLRGIFGGDFRRDVAACWKPRVVTEAAPGVYRITIIGDQS